MNLIKILSFIGFLIIISPSTQAQIFINEIESNSTGIDNKEFVEIRSLAPNTALNGYVLVFFNGNSTSSTANMSYFALDLSNLTTDMNGIVTIGSNSVSPVPNLIISDNVIQNGEDAIAIYQAPLSAFPTGTLASTTNLIHAVAYDNGQPDAVALMTLLNITSPQMNEDENGNTDTESIQRKNDGTFEVKAPTPGATNDGTGFQYNGITISALTQNRTEGDTIHITFSTQTPVTTALNFNFSVSSGNFNTSDYTGTTSISVPVGQSSYTTIITTTDDTNNEGDETMKIKFGTLPAGYNRLNDNIEIRIVDNDYTIDPWGPPTLPTYGIVSSTAPSGYYNSLHGLSGAALKQALQDIIADSTIVRAHNYGDVFDILKEADHHPKNGNQVWLMYVETPRAKLDLQTTGSGTGKWNREHIYPQSRGGFANGTDDIPDGINVYLPTNANNLLAGHADAHHIRAEDATENSTRNNKDYGQDYNGPSGNKGSWKGDVARALFYMAVRYNGLDLVAGNPADTTKFKMGDLDSLLLWNNTDPRDDFEMYRNNYIYTWQQNRNPFIDRPDLAQYIFGNLQSQPYNMGLNATNVETLQASMYPNPAKSQLFVSGISTSGTLEVYNLLGARVFEAAFIPNKPIHLPLKAGLYQLKIMSGQLFCMKKLLVIE